MRVHGVRCSCGAEWSVVSEGVGALPSDSVAKREAFVVRHHVCDGTITTFDEWRPDLDARSAS